MFKVLNISERNLVIGGVLVKPFQEKVFNDSAISLSTKRRIESLSRLGLIKVSAVAPTQEPADIKKTNKKSK